MNKMLNIFCLILSTIMEKLRPTEDFVFKRIFGYEDSKNSLLSLLHVINVIIIPE